MPKKILVATPHPAFGELLRISLEENGPYQVRLVQSGKEAMASVSRANFALAILDADLSEPEIGEVARALQARLPDLRLLVVPLENDAEMMEIEGVRVDGKVTRPYYLPDLLQTVQDLLTPVPMDAPELNEPGEGELQWHADAPGNLPWQRDAATAEALLKDLVKECTADSLLIARLRILYAYAGRLDDSGARQINAELVRYWDGSQKSDLVRFLSHESPEQDSLLYATALADEFILALVYDIPIPLTRCRAQSGKLVRLMMTPAVGEDVLPPVEIQIPVKPVEAPVAEAIEPPLAVEAEMIEIAPLIEVPPTPEMGEETEEESSISDEDEEAMAASLAALLAVMPKPDPHLAEASAEEAAQVLPEEEFLFPWELEEIKPTLVDAVPSPAQNMPGWITAGGEPVSPFSEPVVEEIWWSTLPQAELEKAHSRAEGSVPTPVLPLRPVEVNPEPPIVEAEASAVPEARQTDAPILLPAWMDVATQPLTEVELPLDAQEGAPTPQANKPLPAWMDVATQPLTEVELPLDAQEGVPTPQANKPLPAWMDVATQPLTEAELPAAAAEKVEKPQRSAWEVVDTQPYRIKPKITPPPPEVEPFLGETRQVRTTRQKATPAAEEDSFLAETRPRRAARRSAALEPPTIHLGSPEPAIRITGPLPEGHACICVLIPHVPEHYLVGGMTDLLKQALVQVAAKNHWKVSQVLVRPQYLQWTTETSEEILPDKVAELVRKRLSADIFKQYPALKKQNRSGNFWSTDVLALQGSEPIPAQRLRAFTRQARVNAAPLKKQ